MVMINDAITVVRAAVDAINDRSLGDRAAELLDPSFVRHDLVELFSDSHGPGGASDFVSMIISAMVLGCLVSRAKPAGLVGVCRAWRGAPAWRCQGQCGCERWPSPGGVLASAPSISARRPRSNRSSSMAGSVMRCAAGSRASSVRWGNWPVLSWSWM